MNWQTISKSFINNTQKLCEYFLSVLKLELKSNKYYEPDKLHKLKAKLEKHNYIKEVTFDLWDLEEVTFVEETEYTVQPFTIIVTFECIADGYQSTVTVNLGMFGVNTNIMLDSFEDPYVEVTSDYIKY